MGRSQPAPGGFGTSGTAPSGGGNGLRVRVADAAPRPPGRGGTEAIRARHLAPGLRDWSEGAGTPAARLRSPRGAEREGRPPATWHRGLRALERRSRHRRSHGTAALGQRDRSGGVARPLRGPPSGGAAGAWHRSAPRSWRGKPRRLLGATTVFGLGALHALSAQLRRVMPTGRRERPALQAPEEPRHVDPPLNRAPAAPSPRWSPAWRPGLLVQPARRRRRASRRRRRRPRRHRERPRRRRQPQRGGQLVYGLEAEVSDKGYCLPEAELAISGMQVARALYDTLTVPTPRAATCPTSPRRWSTTTTYRTWTITLRAGHHLPRRPRSTPTSSRTTSTPTGAPTRAAARCCSASCCRTSTTVEVVNELTVRVTTKTPWVAFPAVLYNSGRSASWPRRQLDAAPSDCAQTRSAPGRSRSCRGTGT